MATKSRPLHNVERVSRTQTVSEFTHEFPPKTEPMEPPSPSELLYLHSKCWWLVLQLLLMLLIHLLLHSKYREAIWPHSPSSPQMVSLYSPISLLLTLLLQNSPSTIININGIFLTIPFVIHYFSKVQSSSHKPKLPHIITYSTEKENGLQPTRDDFLWNS